MLNTLDGFNIQPRVSIAFDGAIDVASVNSDSVFLISLGLRSFGDKVGINQVVWDPATNTLHVESDELLEQHTTYAVVVTNRVRDADGKPLKKRKHRMPTMTTTASAIDSPPRRAGRGRQHFHHAERDLDAGEGAGADQRLAGRRRRTSSSARPASARCSRSAAWRGRVQPADGTVAGRLSPAGCRPPALGAIPGVVGTLAFGSYGRRTTTFARRVHPADRHAHRRAGGSAHEHGVLQPGPARRRAAGRRVAGGDLRPRVRRQQNDSPFVVAASMAARASRPSPSTSSGTASARTERYGQPAGGAPVTCRRADAASTRTATA